jgi:hypothetical protein
MKHDEAGNSGERETKKRGRKPKADPQKFHYRFSEYWHTTKSKLMTTMQRFYSGKKCLIRRTASFQSMIVMFRLNNAEMERFLSLYKKSGKRSYSTFIADCILNKSHQVIEVNKSLIDFTMLLSSFFVQFRAIKNNFNQGYNSLVRHFGEEKAWQMIRIVAQSTRDFGLLKHEI